jgi:hypothetical protein
VIHSAAGRPVDQPIVEGILGEPALAPGRQVLVAQPEGAHRLQQPAPLTIRHDRTGY